MVAVNVDHDRERAERSLSASPTNFPIIYDLHGEIAAAYDQRSKGSPSNAIGQMKQGTVLLGYRYAF